MREIQNKVGRKSEISRKKENIRRKWKESKRRNGKRDPRLPKMAFT